MKNNENYSKNKNIKRGLFKREELMRYELNTDEIKLVLKYQELLPVLKQDNDNWIDARYLWEQLGVGRDYTGWINQQIEDLDLQDGFDYFIDSLSKGNQKLGRGGDRKSVPYLIKVSTAKEIAMIAGAKGGRTSKELKERSKIARKYFIIIESAFKNRIKWNDNRKDTLFHCKALKHALLKYRPELNDVKPKWSHDVMQAEFCMFNNIVMGMSASEYRRLYELDENVLVRNTFTEYQLECIADLEEYDSKLIFTQNIFDYDERQKILTKEYENIYKLKNVN